MKITNLELDYNIVIEWNLYKVLRYLLNHKYNKEFTVLTYCEREGCTFKMSDYFIPEQENTGTVTEFDDDDMLELIKNGMDISRVKGHMHSHVNMPTSPSGKDYDEIVERAELAGYDCAIIMNKDMEVFGHIADFEKGVYVEKVPVTIELPMTDEELENSLLADIKLCEDVESIINLVNQTNLEYCLLADPIDDETENMLEEVVDKKFTSVPYYNSSYYNGYNNRQNIGFNNHNKNKINMNPKVKTAKLPPNIKLDKLQNKLNTEIDEEVETHLPLPDCPNELWEITQDMSDWEIKSIYGVGPSEIEQKLWGMY